MNKLLRITGCGNYLHCFYISVFIFLDIVISGITMSGGGEIRIWITLLFFFFSTSINLFIYVDYHKLVIS